MNEKLGKIDMVDSQVAINAYIKSLALHKAKIFLSSARLVSKSEKAGEKSSYFAKNAEL